MFFNRSFARFQDEGRLRDLIKSLTKDLLKLATKLCQGKNLRSLFLDLAALIRPLANTKLHSKKISNSDVEVIAKGNNSFLISSTFLVFIQTNVSLRIPSKARENRSQGAAATPESPISVAEISQTSN